MLILTFLLPNPFSFLNYFSIICFLVIYLSLMCNLIISLSLLIRRVFIFLFLSIIILQLFFVSSNILFEYQIYSDVLNVVFFNNPFSMLLSDLRNFIFFNIFNFIWIIISVAITICWMGLNSVLLKRKLKQ